jgi:hypothetical protein
MCDIPDGIIARLTSECGGNVHDRQVINVASESFQEETYRGNPRSEKNAADLETIS